MRLVKNEWTPLFADIKKRLDPQNRKVMLSRIIGKLQQMTLDTFGKDGFGRPAPWPILSKKYADKWKYRDRTPDLILDDGKHFLRNKDIPHLIDSFRAVATSNAAMLTNDSPYADIHQLGLGWIPARPFYPADESGLTMAAEESVTKIVERHFEPNPF
jgi:phage gpG-like protein